MKVILKGLAAAVTAGFLFTGCDMLNPKPKPDDKASGKGGSGGGNQQQPEVDYSAYVTETTPYPGWPQDTAGLAKGWFFEKKMKTAAGESTTKFAIVDQAGDVWKVESNEKTFAYPGGLIEAVEIKNDGTVPNAYLGKKGGKVKPIKVNPAPKPGDSPKPEESDEDVTVKAGSFKAHKVVVKWSAGGQSGTSTSWMGTDGDAKGILLKSDGGSAPTQYELTALDAPADWKCGANSYKVRHLTYSNGQEMWNLVDKPWPFIGVTVKMVTTGMSYEVTNMGSDAKPDLSWEVAK